jgi:zinc/manganese transport system substrate-binding protein
VLTVKVPFLFTPRHCAAGVLTLGFGILLTACGAPSAAGSPPSKVALSGSAPVRIVAAENQYGSVASQIGGKYVSVTSIEDNPNTDPHSYEVSPSVARSVADAQVVIENGLGYDSFVDKIEAASSSSSRRTINVPHLLGLPDSAPNPHLWYNPRTMPAVATALVRALSALAPAHEAAFKANEQKFVASLKPWLTAIASFNRHHGGTPAATTEPVADYLLSAMGVVNKTPFRFQAAVMNGTDPTPQDISLEKSFFTDHRVKLFCYNEQVTSALTASIRQTALDNHVAVVGVYETMPAGFSYQSWMLAEVHAIENAILHGKSTQHL